MASSGIWENVHISKTTTFDGVCGKLSFIIILNICQIFLFVMLTDSKSTCILFMTDVVVILIFNHLCYWQMLLPCGLMAND